MAATVTAVQANPAFLPFALDARLAAQSALGLWLEEQRLLSWEEAASVLQGLRASPLEQQAAPVAELRDTYAARISRVAPELEVAGGGIRPSADL